MRTTRGTGTLRRQAGKKAAAPRKAGAVAKRPARRAPAKPEKVGRKNMRAPEREQHILEAAIRFFAERGFQGQTRELAKQIGISHSAIYRHFPSKEALVERVYQHVYIGSWQPRWAELIVDRSLPLHDRLTQFYREYAERIFNYEWVRIFVFAGLKSFDINNRYLAKVMQEVGAPALLEARHELGFADGPVDPSEKELFWSMHGAVFYIALRKFVYGTSAPEDGERDAVIAHCVSQFLSGAQLLMRKLHRQGTTLIAGG
jgi:AcrR family transcriptional regulator